MSSVSVDWLENDINEPELSFCNNIFHKKLQIGQNMSSIINNVLRRYHIFLHLTFNAKCCKLLTRSFFVVRFVNDIVELELSFFVIKSFIRKDKKGKICLQKFTTFCVDITLLYILTFNAKCCKLLTSSVFVVRFVNDIVELELSFL